MHDDVRTVRQGVEDERGRDGVVDDEGHTDLMGHRGDGLDVEDVGLGVGDGLGEEGLGVRLHGRPPGVRVVLCLDEGHLDAQALEGVLQQVDGAPVERRRGDDVVACLGDVEQGQGRRGLAARDEQGTDAALERRDPLLDHGLGGVHDPGVDVAELLEREKVRGVLVVW